MRRAHVMEISDWSGELDDRGEFRFHAIHSMEEKKKRKILQPLAVDAFFGRIA